MSAEILLMCTYDDCTAVSRVFPNYVFNDLVEFVCRKWKNLKPSYVSLYYVFPPYPKCMLDCDDDFQTMLTLAFRKAASSIDISVVRLGSCSDLLEVSVVTDVGSSSVNCSRSVDVETDLLPSFCRHQSKVLLSDSWKTLISTINQCFEGGIDEFKRCLIRHSIAVGYEFRYVKNEKNRVSAVCALKEEKKCGWHIYASIQTATGYAYIRKLENEHSCGAAIGLSSNSRLSSDLVCQEILEILRVSPLTRPTEVVGIFKASVGIDITYYLAWMGVEKARNELFGNHALSFDHLRWYFDKALITNPGSRFTIDCFEDSSRFRRCFVCFDACIQGFKACRPMLFLDGTFLKGRYKGTLLAATAKDGNQGLFPFAFAVVSSEDEDNWTWFMEQLIHVVGFERTLTFVSDRNQGLLNAVTKVFPTAFHAYCLEHLKRNLRDRLKNFPNDVTDNLVFLFRSAAYAPDETSFYKKLSAMKHIGGAVVRSFLNDLPVEHWANAFFAGQRYGEMSSNLAESFNSMIQGARQMPVTKLVDMLRLKTMKFRTDRRVAASSWKSVLCPKFDVLLQQAVSSMSTWNISVSTGDVYEVLSVPSVFVNLLNRTCCCGKWQSNGFPCAHAAAAIVKSGRTIYDFIDTYFYARSYRESYAAAIGPVPTMGRPSLRATNAVIRPPITQKQGGRPRKRRIRKKGEDVRKIKCSRCNIISDHNRQTCTACLE